jgi:hypothetical protein
MQAKHILACLAITLAATASAPAHIDAPTPPVVHEWGTFLSVQGSDGVTLGGMVDSDEVLPAFVEHLGPQSYHRAMMFIKMETPVTYFYTDRPQTVQVKVDMPKGLLTHWYPFVKNYGPNPSNLAATPEKSFLDWHNVHLLPSITADKFVPPVSANSTWRFARETDSAFVRVATFASKGANGGVEKKDQYEKFLFYRGLGNFPLPLTVKSAARSIDGLTLQLTNHSSQSLQGVFAVQVENQMIRFGAVDDIAGHGSHTCALPRTLGKAMPVAEGVPAVKQAVARALIEAGLFEKEAHAMVNTWEKSYFRTDGLRLLYLLPRTEVDGAIPIKIVPTPAQLVRVMVGRVEVLTPEREQQIESYISQLGASDFRMRQRASDGLASLGRIGEPALRRVTKTTQDPEVRARASQLIQQFESR